jgi:hypothetical protein
MKVLPVLDCVALNGPNVMPTTSAAIAATVVKPPAEISRRFLLNLAISLFPFLLPVGFLSCLRAGER